MIVSTRQQQLETAILRMALDYTEEHPSVVSDVFALMKASQPDIGKDYTSTKTIEHSYRFTPMNGTQPSAVAAKMARNTLEEGEIVEEEDHHSEEDEVLPQPHLRCRDEDKWCAISLALEIPDALLEEIVDAAKDPDDETQILFSCLMAFVQKHTIRRDSVCRRIHELFALLFDQGDLSPYEATAKSLGIFDVVCHHISKGQHKRERKRKHHDDDDDDTHLYC